MKKVFKRIRAKLFPLNQKQKEILDRIREFEKEPSGEIGCVIFSKDRPIQLFALLESLSKYCKNLGNISIIYNCESDQFLAAYKEVLEESPIKIQHAYLDNENGFKNSLVEILESMKEEVLFFLVDDILFTQDFNLSIFEGFPFRQGIFSLRLGESINYSYMANSPQKQPTFHKVNHNNHQLIKWDWGETELDWNYPLSVDGHLFCKDEILAITKTIDFFAPNSYERELQRFSKFFQKNKAGFSFYRPVLFNNPCNKVQSEINSNRSGDLSPYDLLEEWNRGMIIDISKFNNYQNSSVHEECSLDFKKRLS